MIKELNIFDVPLSGVSLVEAGAGTGKTYSIASLYIRALIEKKLSPKNILVLTYTEAATAELKSRLRNRIKESITALEGNQTEDGFLEKLSSKYDKTATTILKEALLDFEEAQISTIHGFCQRLLKEYSVEFGVSSEFEIIPDDSDLIQDKIDQFWRAFLVEKEGDFEQSVQKFIVDLGYHPDKLLPFVKEALRKNYATLVPEAPDQRYFEGIYEEVERVFFGLRDTFSREESKIQEILESGVLNKTTYNKNARVTLKNISKWVRSGIIPLVPSYRLELFGSSIYQKATRGNTIPDLAVTKWIDDYLVLADNFKLLEVHFLNKAIREIIEEITIYKSKRDLLSYDDLLLTVEREMAKANSGLIKSLRKKYPIAFIDEFQDTDPVQYSIFKSLYLYNGNSGTSLFMIGDPKQAIYSFRGADIYTYLQAKKDANSEQIYSLTQNFRSSKPMMNLVNKVFSFVQDSFVIDGLDFEKAKFPDKKKGSEHVLTKYGKPVEALQFIRAASGSKKVIAVRESIQKCVAKEIASLLNEPYMIDGKRVVQGNIAILVRTHKQASSVQVELRSIGIKSVIRSKESIYASIEALDLLQILNALVNIGFDDAIRSALASQLIGYNAVAIQDLLNNDAKWNDVVQKFQKATRTWQKEGFLQAINQLLNEFDVKLNLAKFFDAERRITNLNHLIELLSKVDRNNVSTPNSIFRYLSKKIRSVGSVPDEELIRLESDEKLVQIVTMHSSKGLEYDIVFCPYLWEDIDVRNPAIFSFHKDSNSYLDIGSNGSERLSNRLKLAKADFSERIRLTYVSLTRAKSACFVFIPEEVESTMSPVFGLIRGHQEVFSRLEGKIRKTKGKEREFSTLMDEIGSFSKKNSIEYRKGTELDIEIDEAEDSRPATFEIKNFSRENLSDFSKMVSFSSLVSGKEPPYSHELEGYDFDEIDNKETGLISDELSVFNFPRGARAGNLLHNIFENVSFDNQESYQKVVEAELNRFGFDTKWQPIIEEWLTASLEHPVLDSGLNLAQLSGTQTLKELEFYFPVLNITVNSINRILGKTSSIQDDRHSIDGFMKGFIDLIFEYEEKYYILDYKSNYLGNNSSEYDYSAMLSSIESSNYDIQYHIYTVALHRFLEFRKSDYYYDNHFGGVIYLFLRGLDIKHTSRGVFFDRPSLEKVLELDELFKRSV